MHPDIVFYQQHPVPYFGVLALVSLLEHDGYHADVVITSLEEDPIRRLSEIGCRLIGISVMSPEHSWLRDTTCRIKASMPDSCIIVGGVHAMLYPEEILEETMADLVCTSEGELVLEKVIAELHKDRPDWNRIDGLAFKDSDSVVTNAKANLMDYSDEVI